MLICKTVPNGPLILLHSQQSEHRPRCLLLLQASLLYLDQGFPCVPFPQSLYVTTRSKASPSPFGLLKSTPYFKAYQDSLYHSMQLWSYLKSLNSLCDCYHSFLLWIFEGNRLLVLLGLTGWIHLLSCMLLLELHLHSWILDSADDGSLNV